MPELRSNLGKNFLENRFGYHLRRASFAMTADLAGRLARLDITISEASILVLINENPGTTQSKIGRALAISRANMVPFMAKLERTGLIERQAADGRSQIWHATDDGGVLSAMIVSIIRAHEEDFLARFSKVRQRQLMAHLAAIWKDIEKAGPVPRS